MRIDTIDRIEYVKEMVNEIIQRSKCDPSNAYIHLYGVSHFCAMIAMKRGIDVELAVIAGMMHDIYSYSCGETKDHAKKGAIMAGEILRTLGTFTNEEMKLICDAISHHSSKNKCDGDLDEVLKDADVLHHCIYTLGKNVADKEKKRWETLKDEFNMNAEGSREWRDV